MASLKKTNSNKKKTFRKNVSKKSLRKSTLKKKVSGGAFPPGLMRKLFESHYLVGCYKQLQEKHGEKCFENMPVKDLFTKCGLIMNEDANEGQKSLNKFTVANNFDFWTLEGWLNWLNTGNIKGKRIIKNSKNLKNIVLINGSKLGDEGNKNVQMAVIGQSNDQHLKKELRNVFKMAVDNIVDEMMKKDKNLEKDKITLGQIFEYNKPDLMQSIFKRFTGDNEDAGDVCSRPDTFKRKVEAINNEKPVEMPVTGEKEGTFKSKEEIEEHLKITIPDLKDYKFTPDSPTSVSVVSGGKRKTYKKTNKKKKK